MNLLLAVDDTAASEIAIAEIAGRTWPENAAIELLTVVEPGHMWTPEETFEIAFQRALETQAKRVSQLEPTGLPVLRNLATGDPKTVILEKAADCQADLIVVGSHRPSAVADLFLGNVAAHTLRNAACSVAIVRQRSHEGVGRRILLATDGSAYSAAAARAVAARPWPAGSSVRILSVMEYVLPTMHALFDLPFAHSTEVIRLRDEALLRAQNAVAKAADILRPSGLAISESVSILLDGTKNVILQEARDWGADWIFAGSHGRTGADRVLMGSVSESLASQAPCSVEVVRARAN